MGLRKYIKRGINYLFTGYKQPVVNVDVYSKTPDNMFKNKVFVVTGGGSGIGLSIAQKLAAEGATVIITGRNIDKLKQAKNDIGGKNKIDCCELDMKKISEFDNFFETYYIKYGHIDGIINNAGVSLHESNFLAVTSDGFDEQFYTNFRGSYFFTQSFIKKYLEKKQTSAKILFISSERGSMCDDIPYGITKSSINSLAKALSVQYYSKGININVVSPGVTATKMTGINKNGDMYTDRHSKRYFLPEEVSEVALFLLSDFAKCISGEIIHTNGGNHIKLGRVK